MRRTLLIWAAVATAALAMGQNTAPDVKALTGKPIPAFKMTDTAGKAHTNDTLKGKVVLLDFWATWCPPCRKSSPFMQKLHEGYSEQGLVVVGANAFERENKDGAAAAYAKEHNYTYPMTVNNDAFARSLNVRGIPTFILIDRKGTVRHVWVGFNDDMKQDFIKAADQLLAEKS